ncbi:multicopper oxidase abr1 [Aspergillus chevalieri]|uniref:Multicopper oxidase Abr1 n=1 Tax=Aspergillus chevalieri TaxID=182096 RepID=A0A7R7VIK8_ASPCH|nr:multicopper oxidase Abr1 [Aspergillus chevalieri]BCR85366.1 multicopper oxidase Abr1 [Aspergillus chevalieri]
MAKAAVLFGLSWLAQSALAKDVHLSWNITWVNAAPNGHSRPVIGINGEWPCPQVDVDLGDRLIVDVYNGLGNQTTGIHWHGFRQYMTGTMDGSSDVTQCPLAPGSKMTYDFMANQTGTYWYHSHNMGQYPDGLRGSLIVHDPVPPIGFDDEFTLTFTDWYNEQMPTLLNIYQSEANGDAYGGREPLPNATLINDASDAKIKVEPNKTYLVHIVCLGNWPGHTWFFEGHDMTVVEVDGVYTVPYPVSDKKLRITTGQRMSVLIRTKPDISRNYAIWDTTDVNMMFFYEHRDIPAGFNPNATAWLVYDEAKELPPAPPVHNLDPSLDFIDDVEFVPLDREPLLEPVDKQIILHTGSAEINGVSRFTINRQTYRAPEVPTLYTALTADDPMDEAIYGQVNPMVVNYGEVVEIVINNHHSNLHPWHLHGHRFQVLQRSAVDGGMFNGYFTNISSSPVQRDTIMVQNNGHSVIRFRADNPDKFPNTNRN